MLIEQLTPEWVPAPDDPGCYQKTIKHGNATIIIVRPILNPEEQKRREAVTIRAAEHFLACVEASKRKNANEVR